MAELNKAELNKADLNKADLNKAELKKLNSNNLKSNKVISILTINSGSSSLKASLFLANDERRDFRYEHIGQDHFQNHANAFDALLSDLGNAQPTLIGHRFVHGGDVTDAVRLIDKEERARLESITHLAPLHMPSNLLGVDLCAKQFNCPQIACFDTAFHATLPEIAYRLPIPQALKLRRYGFHGINYAHVARQLPEYLGEAAKGRIVVAHLGNGASLCLMENLCSVDTSMGYSPAGGIPMGTRGGDMDPGVMLELAKRYGDAELSKLVYQQMGLLALSDGESSEMSVLVKSSSKAAKFAVEYFARQVRAAIGSYAAKSGGIDALIFTGGIGEHSAHVRTLICEPLGFLGFNLNQEANQAHLTTISTASSKTVLIIPADEEAEIARLTIMLSNQLL
ncbi:acetate/propionate family kinase [Methylotenera sp.]|uniref:acetate/propionate family kinase n=1 Tax=Methylotenera sp. TaxID=2051956 RepID=UPI002731667C|nr:acetate kinase [Methylotenera sp.]MDP2071469.1 acetate kinase [Methylotenera sp.]MDP3005430.1 acetate kinase [Methylotenera sp.]MDP3141625.1 acetate kinase [Methylotenera sp.]